jgi:hypothetical protein
MRCELARQAISAELDGEQPAIASEQADTHQASCVACQQWRELAHIATRRARLGGALPPTDLTERVVAAVRADTRRRRARRYWLALAWAVICAGVLQALATVPLMLMARSSGADFGQVRALDIIELVIGAAFFLSAVVVLWQARDNSGPELVRAARVAGSASAASAPTVEEVA